MVAIKENGRTENTAEELATVIKETIAEEAKSRNLIGVGVVCVFIAFAVVGIICGAVYAITWILAYLWNVGIAPLGVPSMTWWQVTAIWILASFVGQIIKKFFKS